MKILVLSDSHGNCDKMKQAVEAEAPDIVFHLGDHSSDAQALMGEYPTLPIISVRGNCDRTERNAPESVETVYDGISILAVHGHLYDVKRSLLRLYFAAKEKAVRVVLFGHTHYPYCEEEDGIWLMNPGSCGRGLVTSYGLIDITSGIVKCYLRSTDERSMIL